MQKIFLVRRALGLTQEECARVIGLDASGFSRIESGERAMSYDDLTKLSEFLGFSIDYLTSAGPKPEDKTVQLIRDQRAKIKALIRAKNRVVSAA